MDEKRAFGAIEVTNHVFIHAFAPHSTWTAHLVYTVLHTGSESLPVKMKGNTPEKCKRPEGERTENINEGVS